MIMDRRPRDSIIARSTRASASAG